MNLLEVLTAAHSKVIGASYYNWLCFGPNAMYIDIGDDALGHIASIIFDNDDGTVYAVELFVTSHRKAWRWIDDRYAAVFVETCEQQGVNLRVAYDNVAFESIEPNDLLFTLNELTKDPNAVVEEEEEQDDPA